MIKILTKKTRSVESSPPGLYGDTCTLYGDTCTLYGDTCTLYGNAIGGICGNLNLCMITQEERKNGIHISELIID